MRRACGDECLRPQKRREISLGAKRESQCKSYPTFGVWKRIFPPPNAKNKCSPPVAEEVTNENWTKIHTYSDGADLKRMKLYPTAGSQKTEEFYYRDGKPVFVFLEANGADKENHDQNATGDKYYFADGKLIAATAADGKSIDVKSAEAKKMSEKLQKESEAFRATVK